MKKNNSIQKFPGFPKEPATNYWPYPRVMNGFWHILTGSEQKVLDYILRHTWGFKKSCDFISYRQFQFGIQRKSGKWFDRGSGIKHRSTLKKAINGLIQKGFLEALILKGKTSFFRLRWSENEPLVQGVNITGSKSEQVSGSGNEPTIKDSTKKDISIIPSVPIGTGGRGFSFQKKKRSGSKKKLKEEPDPRVKEVIEYFIKVCQEQQEFSPEIAWGKESKMIKDKLKYYSVKDLKELIDWFLNMEEPEGPTWYYSPSIGVCFSANLFNKWLQARGQGWD